MKAIFILLSKPFLYVLLLYRWRKLNRHNFTFPKNIFPLHQVKVGKNTYGSLRVSFFDKKNKNAHLSIGNYCSLGENVRFFLCENHQIKTLTTYPLKSMLLKSSSDDAISKGHIVVEDEVWIGSSSLILSGVTISKGAIVASNSVVTKSIPSYAIVGGNPAKIIKYRFSSNTIDKLNKISLADLNISLIKNNMDLFYEEITDENIDEIISRFYSLK